VVKVLFDTNVLIDFLNDHPEARAEIHRYFDRAVCIITWIEVLVGVSDHLVEPTKLFLSEFDIVDVRPEIAAEAVRIRQTFRLKLPDSIIWATARADSRLLVTRNTKDFPAGDDLVRFPYQLSP
jgi:predicted nucleic acid-binding protein